MMKTGTAPFNRSVDAAGLREGVKQKKVISMLLSKQNIITCLAAFFIGRGRLAGSLMPFGLAFYAVACGLEVNRFMLAAAIILGMLTAGAKEQVYVIAASILLFNSFNLLMKNDGAAKQSFKQAITALASFLIPSLLMVYLEGFFVFDLLKVLLSGFTVLLLVFVFKNALPVLNDSSKRYNCTGEEIINVAIMAVLVLSGVGELNILGVAVRNVISILIVLLFSLKFGAGIGAAAGVAAGLLISTSPSLTPLMMGSYALCGLLAGIFRGLKKVGSSLGFVMGNIMLTLHLTGSTEVLLSLKELILAIGIFLLIPSKLMDGLAAVFNANPDLMRGGRKHTELIKEITVKKLNKFSHVFKELSKTFSQISQTKVVTDKNDISSLLDRIADKVCRDCSLCLHCWDRNFYNTYQVMFKIIEKLDGKGIIEQKDIPPYFIERCERINNFVQEANNIYEIFKVDMAWKNRIGECRELISSQFDEISRVVSDLASEINLNIFFDSVLEERILSELNRKKIKAVKVVACENRRGRYEISVLHKACGGKRVCANEIQKLVSSMTGRKMVVVGNDCFRSNIEGRCELKLVEEEVYSVTTGISRVPRYGEKVSGDSYTFINNGDGRFIIALSDGMGYGQSALIQSEATINLLEQFLESGFSKDTAVKFINSILVLKSSEAVFSTIDVSTVDLYSGEVEFVKVGAVPTFIKKEDKIEVVKSISLPAGILSNIEMELAHKKVEGGSFIIMMTDGILDAFKTENGKSDSEIIKFLRDESSMNPQQISDNLLEEACKRCGENLPDDMTVLVAKVWKRAG